MTRNTNEDLCARSWYLGHGYVITSHIYCGIWLLMYVLETCPQMPWLSELATTHLIGFWLASLHENYISFTDPNDLLGKYTISSTYVHLFWNPRLTAHFVPNIPHNNTMPPVTYKCTNNRHHDWWILWLVTCPRPFSFLNQRWSK